MKEEFHIGSSFLLKSDFQRKNSIEKTNVKTFIINFFNNFSTFFQKVGDIVCNIFQNKVQ